MHSLIDVKNKLIEDGIVTSGQFEYADENSFLIHIDSAYTIYADEDYVGLLKNLDNPWKTKSTHMHTDDAAYSYEDTYSIVKEYAENYKTYL